MKAIDLNADLGEGMTWEGELLELVTSANVGCGAHAGSAETTRATVEACLARGIRVGAHPGYPDPRHFGRRTLHALGMKSRDVAHHLAKQVGLIPEAAYIKPHGALYNDSATEFGGSRDPEANQALGEEDDSWQDMDDTLVPAAFLLKFVFVKYQLPLMGLPGTYHEEIAWFSGHPLIREGFIDRRYGENRLLLPRSHPDALILDPEEAADQALQLAETCDSLCIHGDNPESPKILAFVRGVLERSGYSVKAP